MVVSVVSVFPGGHVARLASAACTPILKHPAALVAVLLVIWAQASLGQATAARSPLAPGDDAAIRAQLDTMAAGWNRGDLNGYVSGYADDIVTRGSDGFVSGRAAVLDVLRNGYWKSGRPAQTLRVAHVTVRGLDPEVAIATGQYILTGGGQPDHTGWFTTVWKRTALGWRCVHDHSSA